MRLPQFIAAAALATVLATGAPAPASAMEAGEKIWLHGYGNWAYGKTDGNTYANGNDEGNYDRLEFSLSVAAEPAANTSVHAQIFVENEEGGAEAAMDFAFAEYAFDPALKFRIGAVKQPFGIFTEIFDVGTLYPFVNLAQGLYGPTGLVSESYLGLGFTGRFDVGGGWALQYDLYGGEMEAAFSRPWAEGGEEAEEAAEADEAATDIQDLIGGRVNVTAPGQSLTFGVSAYTGTEDSETFGEESESHRQSAFGAHAEYLLGPATLRAEFARKVDPEEYASNAAYAEASWKLTRHWLLAARYDWSKTDLEDGDDVDGDLLEHGDVGIAVNYFFNPNFVLKLAVHQVAGNRFTSVDDEDEEQDEKTNFVTFGTSFSF